MKWAHRAGIALSALATLFFAMDAIGKLLQIDPVMQGTQALGWPTTAVIPLGVLLLVGAVLYAMPCSGRSTSRPTWVAPWPRTIASDHRSPPMFCSVSMSAPSCGEDWLCAILRCAEWCFGACQAIDREFTRPGSVAASRTGGTARSSDTGSSRP